MAPFNGASESPEDDVRSRLPSMIEDAFLEDVEGVGEDSRFCRVERMLICVAMCDSAIV